MAFHDPDRSCLEMSRRTLLKYAAAALIAACALYFVAAVVAREYRKRNLPLDLLETSIDRDMSMCEFYLFNGTAIYRVSPDRGTIYAAWEATSGIPDESGAFRFSPEDQKRPSAGPIPAGRYRIPVRLCRAAAGERGIWSLETWNRVADAPFWRRWLTSGLLQARDADTWGHFFAQLNPYPETNCFGRNFFVLHGGTRKGSRGCIDLGNNEVDLFRDMLEHFQSAGGADIWVDYDYSPPADLAVAVKPARWAE